MAERVGKSTIQLKSTAQQLDNVVAAIGDLQFRSVSQTEYDEITHDDNTIYYVTDDNGKVTAYKGDAQIGSAGAVPGYATMSVDGTEVAEIGYAEYSEIEER